MNLRKRTRGYGSRYRRRGSKNITYWQLPRPILKYSYKQSIQLKHHWQFGWGRNDDGFVTFDYMDEPFFNEETSLAKYFALQYGQFIINKIKIVINGYDFSKYYSAAKQPAANMPGEVKPDSLFNKDRMYFEFYAPNNRDDHGVPILTDRYEYVKRVPFGRSYTHTYYPRCKQRIKCGTGVLHSKLGDIVKAMASPDQGRNILFIGFGPLTDIPTSQDTLNMVRYEIGFTANIYIHCTFTSRNIQQMI